MQYLLALELKLV